MTTVYIYDYLDINRNFKVNKDSSSKMKKREWGKHMKFERKILIVISVVTCIILITVVLVSFKRGKVEILNAMQVSTEQSVVPENKLVQGPVSENYETTTPVDEATIYKLASEFNAQNSESKSSDIISQSQTNQDLLLMALNGDATKSQGIKGFLNKITNEISSFFKGSTNK